MRLKRQVSAGPSPVASTESTAINRAKRRKSVRVKGTSMTTAERIIDEGAITTGDVATMAGRFATATATVVRWIRIGVPGMNGRVKLEAIKVGGVWQTSLDAYLRFVDAQNGIDQTPQPIVAPAKERRTRRKKATAAVLEAFGV